MTATSEPMCANGEPHLHPVVPVFVLRGEFLIVDGRVVGVFPTHGADYAARCAELLRRHGLVDIPDTVEGAQPYCPTCGRTAAAPWAGCRDTFHGSPLPPPTPRQASWPVCPHCGAPVASPVVVTCPNCGRRL